jgi:hypothetical protein
MIWRHGTADVQPPSSPGRRRAGSAGQRSAAQTPPSTRRPRPFTTPLQQFGAAIGDDYFLANYTQLEGYWKTLDRQSDGCAGRYRPTEEGRSQWMAIISSPENWPISIGIATSPVASPARRGLSDEQARALASEGKAVVWIDGGLHANEVLGAQQLIETVYQLVSATIARRFACCATSSCSRSRQPDGHELVANWYMREKEPRLRRLTGSRGRTRSTSATTTIATSI